MTDDIRLPKVSPAEYVETVLVQADSEGLSDAEFRELVRRTIHTVEMPEKCRDALRQH